MSYVDGTDYDTPSYSGSEAPTIRSEFSYDYSAAKLESSIAASAAPTDSTASRGDTIYFGVSASASTPVGGAVLGAGLYSVSDGMMGAYFTAGGVSGIPGLSLAAVGGRTESLAGESYGVSLGAARPGVVIGPGISGTAYFDASTNRQIGSEVSLGFSVGPPVGATVSYTSTRTTEFTSLYLDYLQFVDWASHSGQYGIGDWER